MFVSEYATILVTRRGEMIKDQLKAGRENVPTLKQAFAENSDMKMIGEDSIFCARFAVPADKKEQILADVQAQGYIAENDYSLSIGTPFRPF